jgi:hypothetical protein
MHNIYIGYSPILKSSEVIKYFDIDPDSEDGSSKFEKIFGSDYISPGNFEVYGREDYIDYEFNLEFVEKLFPFSPERLILNKINISCVETAFYIEVDKVDIMENEEIFLVGSMQIEKYNFE